MKATVTPEAESAIADIATRYSLSREAVLAMLFALHTGGGTMAQFSIPELGGSGQWMRGGMTMVGDMFDNALKARVDALCNELSQLLTTETVFPASASRAQSGFTAAYWWPADLGVPSATGGQNDARYAVFPGTRRLVIQINGVTKVFDTGDHQIGGVQQQQGGGFGTVQFTSQLGTFDVSSLRELGEQQVAETAAAAPAPRYPATSGGQSQSQFQTSPAQPSPGRSQYQTRSAPPSPGQSQYQTTSAPPSAPRHQAPPPPPAHAQTTPPQPAAPAEPSPAPQAAAHAQAGPPPSSPAGDPATIVAAIESLAGLHQRGILSDEEFAAKKAELLARL